MTEIKELEIQKLKVELNQMKPLLKTYEDQNIKIVDLEKKISNYYEKEKDYKEVNQTSPNYYINYLIKPLLYSFTYHLHIFYLFTCLIFYFFI